jgi:hypothetical protein
MSAPKELSVRSKFMGGLAALALAGTALVGLSTSASATVLPAASSCVPHAAQPEVSHTEYQWAALVLAGGLHWEYKWTPGTANPTSDLAHIWVKSRDLAKAGLPQITRVVVDTPAAAAVDCSVTLPSFDLSPVCQTPLANVTVPYTAHVKTYLYGVTGYDEHVAITGPVNVTRAMAGQFWIGYVPDAGYVAANAGQWHIDFQFACDFGVPSVVAGTPQYGTFEHGTWKVGSKVTLADGSEFQTHGGTDVTGPITRFRLVFTPDAGYTLPATLPGDGVKVSGSAVYLVYVPAAG